MKVYAIRVGDKSNGYILDNKVFDKKKEARQYRKEQGYPSYNASKHWFIVKLGEIA